MLSDQEFDDWCRCLNLPQAARKIIEPLLKGNKLQNQTVPARTVRRWKTNFTAAQQKYNCGYIGELIAQSPKFISPPPREIIKTILEFYVHQYTPDNVSAFGRKFGLSRH